jgi:hypothetical protein
MKATASHSRQVAGSSHRFRLLIKEAGSAPLTSGGAEAFDETIVIAQMKAEAPAQFAERVLERVAALGRSGHRLSSAILQAGQQEDATLTAARRSLLLALVTEARRVGDIAEVLLETGGTVASPGAGELLQLVEQLLQLPECDAVPIRVRFQGAVEPGPELDSGVFWLPPSERSRAR